MCLGTLLRQTLNFNGYVVNLNVNIVIIKVLCTNYLRTFVHKNIFLQKLSQILHIYCHFIEPGLHHLHFSLSPWPHHVLITGISGTFKFDKCVDSNNEINTVMLSFFFNK